MVDTRCPRCGAWARTHTVPLPCPSCGYEPPPTYASTHTTIPDRESYLNVLWTVTPGSTIIAKAKMFEELVGALTQVQGAITIPSLASEVGKLLERARKIGDTPHV